MSALPKKQDLSHLSVAIIRTAPENLSLIHISEPTRPY